MGPKLTWDEIRRQHPDEEVVLIDVDADDETLQVHGGVVLGHGKSEKAVCAATKEKSIGTSGAVLFTGVVGRGHFLF